MPEVVDRLIYALDGDLAPFKARAAELDAEAGRLAGTVKAQTAGMFDGAAAGASKVKRELDAAAGSAQKYATALNSAKTGAFFSETQAGAAKLLAARQAMAAVEKSAVQMGSAVKLQSHQIVNLGYQVQDTLVQLASGQNPLMVLMQQGPQATSAVGGLGNALKLLGGASGIARLALGGLVVGGIGAVAFSSIDASEKAAKLEMQLRLVGNAAGVTRGQVEAMARSLDQSSTFSFAGAERTIGILASRGNVQGPLLPSAATAAHNLDTASSMNADEAAAYIEKILADPKKGAEELHSQFKLLTAAEQRHIEELANSGRAYEAQKALLEAMNPRFEDAANQASVLSRALAGAAGAASNFLHWLGGLTRGPSLDQQIADKEALLRSYRGARGVSAGAIKQTETELAGLRAQRDKPGEDAKKQQQDDAIRAGLGYLPTFNVEGGRTQQRKDAVTAIQAGIAAAKARGDKESEAQLQIALKNAQNPDYKAGSGVPKAAAGPRVDTGARDAELARMELANLKALAAADPRDRESLRAKQQAELEYQRSIADPRRKAYAGTIRDARLEQIPVQAQMRNDDAIRAVNDEAAAQAKLAEAYGKGTAAAQAQKIANEAHAAFLQGIITDEKAYAEALQKRAAAQAAATTAQTIADAKKQNEALTRLVGAGGDPAAMAAARRENEALAATQAERDAARTKEEIELANTHLDQLRQELALRDKLQAQAAANDNMRLMRDELELKKAQIALTYADVEARVKEIAAIQAYQQTVREGYIVGSEEFKRRYEELKKINEQLGMADAVLSGQTKNVQILDRVRQGLSDVAMAGTHGFKSMREAAASFFRQLGDLIIQLYVIKPLLEYLLGTDKNKAGGVLGSIIDKVGAVITGGKGGGTTSAIASLFGGGRAAGGPVDPGKFYLVGENGPELLGPGVGGNVYPLRPPSSRSMQPSATGRQELNISYQVVVSGNGDKELLGRMQAVAESTVRDGLQSYSQADNRAIIARVRQADRRRIR